jgi:hypothetical protein
MSIFIATNNKQAVRSVSNKLRILLSAVFAVTVMSGSAWAHAVVSDQSGPDKQLAKANSDLVSAANRYKASVEALIPHYQDNLKTAAESLEKRKELFARGLISKRDLELSEQAVKDARSELDQTQAQLMESDHLIAEAKAEVMNSGSPSGPGKTGHYTASSAVMRYNGTGGWALNEASKVESFFASKFSRQLPISALGQSGTHNRLGFDHRNSIDVALHPDSAEGKALIDYLRSNGIPFLAFRSAIRGVATGAHIHIGLPSHRIG